MSRKVLWILVGVLAVLAGALWWNGRPGSAPGGSAETRGRMLPPSVELNTVRAITIEDGTDTTRLAKTDEVWCLPTWNAYPADFDRLAEMIRSIDATENAQIAEQNPGDLTEYGLADGGDIPPVRITLEHEAGSTVVSLGQQRESPAGDNLWGPPGGRYVRVDEGPVLLIAEDIAMAEADPETWWDRRLVEAGPESIRRVEIGPGDEALAIERETDGTFTVAGGGEGETVDPGAANRLFGAWRNLRADEILPDGEEADAAFTEAISRRAEVDGVSYLLRLGTVGEDPANGRPVRLEVTALPDATPEQQAAAERARRKLDNRTFRISASVADALGLARDALIREPEPVPEESEPEELEISAKTPPKPDEPTPEEPEDAEEVPPEPEDPAPEESLES